MRLPRGPGVRVAVPLCHGVARLPGSAARAPEALRHEAAETRGDEAPGEPAHRRWDEASGDAAHPLRDAAAQHQREQRDGRGDGGRHDPDRHALVAGVLGRPDRAQGRRLVFGARARGRRPVPGQHALLLAGDALPAVTDTGVWRLVDEYATLPSLRCRPCRYASARESTAPPASTATSPWTAYEVDWAFESRPRNWPKPPSSFWFARSQSTARRAAGPRARPTAARACNVAPVMSLSLVADGTRPKPPSSLCAFVSHATVGPPAGSPEALRARMP